MRYTEDVIVYRLRNQGLSQNEFSDAAEVVRQLGAVQAQGFAGAKWAIGLRTNGLTDPDVECLFANGSILRTHLLRPTWHFVAPEDIRWMLALSAPWVRAQLAYMDRQLELGTNLFSKSNTVLTKALQGGKQLTRAELEPAFQRARIPAEGQRLGHLLMHAELDGLVCSGLRKGKQFTYALLEERVPPAKTRTREEALAELVKRYFFTRGPATLQDFTWWSGLTLKDAREGKEVKSQFTRETVEDQTYWFSASTPSRPERSLTAYLLPNYDEFFIGYKDRSAITAVAEQAGVKKSDSALLSNVILLEEQSIGGWKRTLQKDSLTVDASLITGLTKKQERAVTQAAEKFGDFLGLPVTLNIKESTNEQRTTRSF